MNSRERVLTAIANKQADHVPCAPDMYEMVPIRLSGRPSWDLLVYQDPPIWKMRVDCVTHFGVDGFIPLWVPLSDAGKTAILERSPEKMITRDFTETENGKQWGRCAVIYMPNEPSAYVLASSLGLGDDQPEGYEVVKPNYTKFGREYYEDARAYAGDRAVIAPMVCLPALPHFQDDIMEYYTDPEGVAAKKRAEGESMLKQAEEILSWNPDVLLIGNSGLMVFNPPQIFRHLALEWMQKVTKLAKDHGVLTHIHCCGPERALVEIAANETDLNCIEPLEIPPMGDCDLKEIKQKFGHKLAFKGNLHTTDIMLKGTPQMVEDACKKAIDDAGEGGGFILSTGDQTPRDVPEETLHIMQRVAETYGRY